MKTIFSKAATVTVAAGALLCGGIAPVQAEQSTPGDVTAYVYNDYSIHNDSGVTLTLLQPPRQGNHNGFIIEPPKTISPWEQISFRIKYRFGYSDDTTIWYTTDRGDQVVFQADRGFFKNYSFCQAIKWGCETTGEFETVFRYGG